MFRRRQPQSGPASSMSSATPQEHCREYQSPALSLLISSSHAESSNLSVEFYRQLRELQTRRASLLSSRGSLHR